MAQETMKAVRWEGKPYEVAVRHVPKPKLQEPQDVIVRVTTVAICGSDLHIYRGRFGSRRPPWTLGHEAIGVIVEAGNGVKTLKVGDRAMISALIMCGHCDNCLRGDMSHCLTYHPETQVDVFGGGPDFGADIEGCLGM